MSKRKLDDLGVSAFCESMAMMVQAGIQTDEAIALLQSGKEHTGGVLEHGLQSLRRVSQCIQTMHKNGIMTERIEAELPPMLKVHYTYADYHGDSYEQRDDGEGEEAMMLWCRES